MCGIVGILGAGPVADQIVEALKRLEYRGYDSAGIATLEGGALDRRRAPGKLKNLEIRLSNAPLRGAIGIGHTRWATHGRPSETNAHPHASDRLAVVHNGIIENFRELREELSRARPHVFTTETDTEIVAHLVTASTSRRGRTPKPTPSRHRCPACAARSRSPSSSTARRISSSARAAVPPLAVGYGAGRDVPGLGRPRARAASPNDMSAISTTGDWVVLTGTIRSPASYDEANRPGDPRAPPEEPRLGALLADKGNYRHFMAKEIHEQPEVVGRTHRPLHRPRRRAAWRFALRPFPSTPLDDRPLDDRAPVEPPTYAGLIAKYWFESHRPGARRNRRRERSSATARRP